MVGRRAYFEEMEREREREREREEGRYELLQTEKNKEARRAMREKVVGR